MEPEGSLPHSQASATCLYPGPPQSSPYTHIPPPNIINPSTPWSVQWSPSLRFPHQDTIRPPLLTHTRHMPNPSHSSKYYHPMQNLRGTIQACTLWGSHGVTLILYLVYVLHWPDDGCFRPKHVALM